MSSVFQNIHVLLPEFTGGGWFSLMVSSFLSVLGDVLVPLAATLVKTYSCLMQFGNLIIFELPFVVPSMLLIQPVLQLRVTIPHDLCISKFTPVLQKLTIVRQPGGITNAAPNKANFNWQCVLLTISDSWRRYAEFSPKMTAWDFLYNSWGRCNVPLHVWTSWVHKNETTTLLPEHST